MGGVRNRHARRAFDAAYVGADRRRKRRARRGGRADRARPRYVGGQADRRRARRCHSFTMWERRLYDLARRIARGPCALGRPSCRQQRLDNRCIVCQARDALERKR